MKNLFLLLSLISLLIIRPYQLDGQQAQDLSFSIIDKNSGQPVEDAFVFFAGSSVGTVSTANGEVEISWQEYAELVISHLNYTTRVIPPDSVLLLMENPTLLLTPRVVSIEEVTVRSSEKYVAKRKKWLKRFENAFLGKRKDRKGVNILNPEVLLFAEDENGLRVEANDQIQIANRALGYELSFFLDTFLLTKQQEVLYSGKVFFEDMQAKQEARARAWEGARSENFKRSKAHFFRALISEELDPDQYEFGQSQFDDQLKFIDYQKLESSDLQIRRGPRADTLLLQGFLTIVNRNIITKWVNNPQSRLARNEFATSFLRSRSGRFIISPTGLLINNREVEELGYWAEQRVARLLPTNYQDGSVTPTSPVIDRYLDALIAYRQNFPLEKAYLHLDKPYYSVNDDLWFKAYLLDAADHQPTTPSKVLHVELIDPDGNIVRSLQLHQDQTMSGGFQLAPIGQSGIFHIRAYTEYMAQTNEKGFFQRSVLVYDPADLGDQELTGISLDPRSQAIEQGSKLPFHLQVSPEGGALVGNLESTLVLHLTDTLGAPLALSGSITDRTGASVVSWTTEYDGWGLLKFKPLKGNDYWVALEYQGQTYRIPLPESQDSGMVLHVNNTRDEEVFIKISTTPEQSTEGAFLIGHVRGQVFCRMDRIVPNENIAFFRDQIPSGVACFSLLDQEGQLLSQRLFFNDLATEETELQVASPYAFYYPRQKVELEISWADSLIEQGANLSVAVTDRSLIFHDEGNEHIRNYLLLNSDLPVPVSQPGKFLLNPDQRKRFLLDLQLIAADQRNFIWNKRVGKTLEITPILPERSAYLKGYVAKKDKPSQVVKAEVLLTALHPQPTIAKVITDDEGNFTFFDLPYLDTVDYVLQAAIFDPQRSTDEPLLTSRKRNVDIHLSDRETPNLPKQRSGRSLKLNLPEGILAKFSQAEQTRARVDSLYKTDWQIDLDEVTVRGKKIPDARNFGVFNLNKLDWIPPNKSAYSLLSSLRPTNRYIQDLSTDQLQAEIRDPRGKVIRVPVIIYINGMRSTFTRFQILNADMIDFISVGKTFIAVTTRAQPRSGNQEDRDGLLFFTHNGFYPGQLFPGPDYSDKSKPGMEKPDLRTTVHWEPKLRLNAHEKAVLSFYAADTPTEYEIKIEGISDAGDPVYKTYIVKISN